MGRGARLLVSALAAVVLAAPAASEPTFLSRQYPRCTNCHFSPTGGGLLTPYGRALSREELSTFGRSQGPDPGREQEFLYGVLGDTRPLSLGVDLRPSHLEVDSQGFSSSRDFLMNAELTAAMRLASWTLYAELGRQPRGDDPRVASFEHWVAYQSEGGVGARAGRFIPAYGVKFADHTSFNRSSLSLDNNDQVYGLELSYNGDRHLVQVSVGPGRADDVDDADRRAFTTTGRWQYDVRSRVVTVVSGLYRAASELEPRRSAVGLALGVAPTSHLTLWGQADARFQEGETGGPGYTLVGEASFEVHRGVWLRFSPQLLTDFGDTSAGVFRLNVGLNLLPRTHWNVIVSWSHDRVRQTDVSVDALLAQLHLYL